MCIWDVVALCWMWTCLVNGKIEKYYVYLYICINLYIHVCICVCIDKAIYIYFPKKMCVCNRLTAFVKIIRLWKTRWFCKQEEGTVWSPLLVHTKMEVLWINSLIYGYCKGIPARTVLSCQFHCPASSLPSQAISHHTSLSFFSPLWCPLQPEAFGLSIVH